MLSGPSNVPLAVPRNGSVTNFLVYRRTNDQACGGTGRVFDAFVCNATSAILDEKRPET